MSLKPIIRVTTILLLAAISVLSSGCEKTLFDRRNKYMGNYDVDYHSSWHNIQGDSGSETAKFKAKLYYHKGDMKSQFKMDYYSNTMVLEVNKNEQILKDGQVVGKFNSKNSFTITFSGGGLGGSGTTVYEGRKEE